MNGNGRYRKLGVIVPLENENNLFREENVPGKGKVS